MSKLKIFMVNGWHVPHIYELVKLADKQPVEFYLLLNNVRKWVNEPTSPPPPRPIPKHINFVTAYEKGKYDLAILQLDQQCVNPDIGKGFLYKQLNEQIQDIPKIVINHGTPNYKEMYDEEFVLNGGDVHNSDGSVRRVPGMKELIGDNFMIVNSYDAVKRWGWGYPVIHGMDPDEWWDLPKEPRIVTQLSPGGLDDYNNRSLLSNIKSYVYEQIGTDLVHFNTNYHVKSWDDQRYMLGTSLFYINQTKDSPMPRSRTEAMFSGACVLSSKHHNADEFIESGVNGFIIPDNPMNYVDTLKQLFNHHYRDCVEIGKKARETAIKYFHVDLYHRDIWKVIEGVANGKPPTWDNKKRWDKI